MMKLEIVRFKNDGMFGLRDTKGNYFDKDLNIQCSMTNINSLCKFDSKQKITELLESINMEVDVLETIEAEIPPPGF